MALITTGSHPKALWPGVKRWWGTEYERHQPLWKMIFDQFDSSQAYEEDVEQIGFGYAVAKPEGGGISYDTAHQGPTSRYNNLTYALGYMVTMEELEDNLYEKVSFKRASKLARSFYEMEETVHANILNRAFTSAYAGGDGKELVATDHPTDSGNQSNELTVAADLSEAAIEDLLIQISDATDSRGLKIRNNPRRLIVPNALQFESYRIVKSVLQNDTANNAVNAIKAMNVFPDGVLVYPYLDDPDTWFIQTDNGQCLTHYTRKALKFDQDNDFDTKNMKAAGIERFSAGWSDWRGLYGSSGA